MRIPQVAVAHRIIPATTPQFPLRDRAGSLHPRLSTVSLFSALHQRRSFRLSGADRRRETEVSRGKIMSIQSTESSHPLLSHTDGVANSTTDVVVLIGRILIGWLFLSSSWGKLMNIEGFAGYLKNLQAPSPEIFSWIGAI